jgi:tetratricopeptide (TPR) repeat protein
MKISLKVLALVISVPLAAVPALAKGGAKKAAAMSALRNNNASNDANNGSGAGSGNTSGGGNSVPGDKNYDGNKHAEDDGGSDGFQNSGANDDANGDQDKTDDQEKNGDNGGEEQADNGGTRPHLGLNHTGRHNSQAEDEGDAKSEGSARPRPVYKDCVARALKYVAQKKYSSAAAEYNKALGGLSAEDPRKVYVYERLGWLSLMQNDVQGAEGFYVTGTYQAENIETYDASAVSAYRGAAFCYEKDGDIPSAIENYTKALKYTTDKEARKKLQKKIQSLKAGGKKR